MHTITKGMGSGDNDYCTYLTLYGPTNTLTEPHQASCFYSRWYEDITGTSCMGVISACLFLGVIFTSEGHATNMHSVM